MPKKIDMLGKTYGRLKVIEESGRTNGGEVMWRCICECGEERSIVGYDLRSGSSKSCGCLKLEILRDRVSVHNMSRTRFYNIWSKMIQRCNNPNTTEYINYGGRGIKVTDRWLTHEYFMEDMFESYLEHVAEYGELDTTIDRINNEGGYDPVNCKWSTRLEQVRNRRKNSTNKSGVSGVHWDSRSNRWLAGITVNGNRIRLGSYKELELAAEARKQAELDYWS